MKTEGAPRPFEAIIFDLDGTLVDARIDIVNSVNHMLKAFGFAEKSFREVSSFIGGGVRDLMEKALQDHREADIERALVIFEKYYRAHCADHAVVYPHVRDILEHFRQKRKVIATNRNREFAEIVMRKLSIIDYFEDIVGGDSMDCLKPSACQLDMTIGRLKVEKKSVIMVGDMDIDVMAGKQAGIATCAVLYGLGKKEDIMRSQPDYTVSDIIELKEIIR